MVVLSTLVTNTVVVEIEEEDTEVANSTNWDCFILGVVGMESNRVGIVVENYGMLVDL